MSDIGIDLSGLITALIVFALLLFLLHIVICIWSYRDCLRRGKSQEYAVIVLFGLLFFPIIGLIVYLVIRKY
jgi:heme/copper-type cytochrome/quinol oxidase subunit 2